MGWPFSKKEPDPDWSESMIQAKAVLKQAENELARGHIDSGRRLLRSAIYGLTKAADILSSK